MIKKISIIKKIIFYLISLFILVASVNFIIPLASDTIIYSIKIYEKLNRTVSGIKNNPYDKPNFKNIDWAEKHFEEFIKLKLEYHDYLIWRRQPFNGETIKIDSNGFRLNNNSDVKVSYNEAEAWFFGGSTMWGSGSKNELTIPSYFERFSNIKSANFGETGYTSNQELNLLIKYISYSTPKIVVFYDGANDIYNKCRVENTFYSSSIEKKIKPLVEQKIYLDWYNLETKNLFKNNLKVFQKLKNFLIEKLSHNKKIKYFDCDTNRIKSKLIVENLINNWKIAKFLVESKDKQNIFIPILQPLSFFTKSKTEHIDDYSEEVKRQYEFMYDLVRKELKKNNFRYLDFTKKLDDSNYYFWDHAHLSPNGNEKIALSIIEDMKKFK